MLLTPWVLAFVSLPIYVVDYQQHAAHTLDPCFVGGPTYVVDLREFLKPKLSEEFQPEPLLLGKVYSTCVTVCSLVHAAQCASELKSAQSLQW